MGDSVKEVGERIRAIRQRDENAQIVRRSEALVREAVSLLLQRHQKRFLSPYHDQQDFRQEGLAFLFGKKGRLVLDRAERASNPDQYVRVAVYRYLLRLASKQYRFGCYKPIRSVRLQVGRFWRAQFVTADRQGLDQGELQLLLGDPSEQVGRYLTSKVAGLTDVELKEEWGWTRTELAQIAMQASNWLARQFPDEVGKHLNTSACAEYQSKMQELFRYCATEDPLCSVLFAPAQQEDRWFVWGQLAEVAARSVGRPAAPQLRLALANEEVIPVLGDYLRKDDQPAVEGLKGKFWYYSDVCV